MIKSQLGRWWCDQCDELYNEHGVLSVYWTAGSPPSSCPHCDELVCLVIWGHGRPAYGEVHYPAFVSIPMKKSEAAGLQRKLKEGGFCTPERGRELKGQMVNSGRQNIY